MKKVILKTLVATLLLIFFLTGCGKNSNVTNESVGSLQNSSLSSDGLFEFGSSDDENVKSETESNLNDTVIDETEKQASESDTNGYLENQKLIYECNLEIQTLKFNDSIKTIKSLIEKYNGFVESDKVSDDSYDWFYKDYEKKYGTMSELMVVRIPSESYDEFLKEVGDIGKVINKSEKMTNITKTYNNTLAVIEMLEKEEDLLLKMMDKSTTISEMITIEQRLSEVQKELAVEKSSKETMDVDVAFSTVTINVEEVMEYSKATSEKTFADKIFEAFKRSFSGFGNFLTELCVFVILIFPYILIVIAIIFIIVKYKKNKNGERKWFVKTKNVETKSKNNTKEVNHTISNNSNNDDSVANERK